MNEARGVEIVDSGLLATVQDLGRNDVGAFGVSPSGAADWLSARCANRLVGNPPEAALIEATMSGLHFVARQTMMIAITGATALAVVGGAKRSLWQSLRVRAGSDVKISAAERGLRSYVAFFGGICVPQVLRSRSTDVAAGFGGVGRALVSGDVLALNEVEEELPDNERSIRGSARPFWHQPATLRVLPGAHASRFAGHEIESLCSRPYRVSARSNRQGLRLEGPALRRQDGFDVLSCGVCAGCVQITSEGTPVVLLAEHQTTGGYAVPFAVITADLPDAAQLRPGDEVRFAKVTPAEASVALSEKMEPLREAFDEPSRAG